VAVEAEAPATRVNSEERRLLEIQEAEVAAEFEHVPLR
jgi:hypothetical protein